MSSIDAAPQIAALERTPARFWRQGAVAVVAWVGVALLIAYFPNATRNWPMTQGLANLCLAVAALIGLAGILGRWFPAVQRRARPAGAWLIALPLLLGIWDLGAAHCQTGVVASAVFCAATGIAGCIR